MTNREIYAARDEFYDPQPGGVIVRGSEDFSINDCVWLDKIDDSRFTDEPIHTEPGDLDEAHHETEGAATFVVSLIVIVLAACAGWWVAMSVGA